jgi:hypothetical protein
MITALFDERRRKEICNALKSGKPIEFRRMKPKADVLPAGVQETDGGGSRLGEAMRALNPFSFRWFDGRRHERISTILGDAFRGRRYGTLGPSGAVSAAEIMMSRVAMATAGTIVND